MRNEQIKKLRYFIFTLVFAVSLSFYGFYKASKLLDAASEQILEQQETVKDSVSSLQKSFLSNFIDLKNLETLEKIKNEFFTQTKKVETMPKTQVFVTNPSFRKKYFAPESKIKEEFVSRAQPVTTKIGDYKCVTLNGFTEIYNPKGKLLGKYENKFESYRQLATEIEKIKASN
ncbi:hypothetical protein IT568_12875 [bacterium]|nr:hypothetical protein [bacterium]